MSGRKVVKRAAASPKAATAFKKATGKKPVARKKGANGYATPEPLPLGTTLTDLKRVLWKVGPAIGSGGFGDIYSAHQADKPVKRVEDYPVVVKIEPHENGPLFVERSFYISNAKQEDIDQFAKSKNLKAVGMPCFLGSGSHMLNNIKHRFVLMPRYGKDIWNLFLENDRVFPVHTVYRLANQILDVLEYIHSRTYVHGDIKGANLLMGLGKNGKSQIYLVDFGLATHYTTKEFKPNPNKMHNGTAEYTSIDAHKGVPTRRGDLEILGYNLMQWCGTQLPWEKANILGKPKQVQEMKEKFMESIDKNMKECFPDSEPDAVTEFLKYIKQLGHDEEPDYAKCKQMFAKRLAKMKKPDSGDLEFVSSSESKSKATKRSYSSMSPGAPQKRGQAKQSKIIEDDDSSPEKKKPGQKGVVVNNHCTVAGGVAKKTYKLNLQLDVSGDADVVINVERKRRVKPVDPAPEKVVKRSGRKNLAKAEENSDEDMEVVSSSPEVVRKGRTRVPMSRTKK